MNLIFNLCTSNLTVETQSHSIVRLNLLRLALSDTRRKWNNPSSEVESNADDHESEVKKGAENLKELHGEDKYDSRQLMLWDK